jgi:predicted nucleic acid-binding protein
MALADVVFFDTSVFVAGLIEMGDASLPADRILDAVARRRISRPITAWHCCLEFYSVATRLPAGLRLAPADARRLLQEEVLDRFTVCDLPADARASFLASAASDGIAGGRIYDAHIGETARLAGATLIVTDNARHFASVMRHGLAVLTAPEFADTYL